MLKLPSMRSLLYSAHHLRNTGEKMCFINLLPYAVITGLDTHFVNIFSSISSYCLHLLSPALILHGLSQRVTDVPLITNVEDWIYSWKSLEDKREVLWIIQASLSLFHYSICAFVFLFRSPYSLKSPFSHLFQNPLKVISPSSLSWFRLAFSGPNIGDMEHENFPFKCVMLLSGSDPCY